LLGTAALVMPASCKAALALAAIPLAVIGLYVPAPLQDLLGAAAAAMGGRTGGRDLAEGEAAVASSGSGYR